MKITNRLRVALKSILSIRMGEVATDKATLVFDGETLEKGIEVFVLDENGEPTIPEDGEYIDGERIIVVKEGIVDEIKEKEVEEPVEQEEEPAPVDSEEANGDEPVAPSIEERLAAVEAFVAGVTDGLQQIVNAIAALEERVASIEEKVNVIEATPAAEPVEEPVTEEPTKMSRLSYLRK